MIHNFEKPPLITPEVPPVYRSAIKTVAEQWNDTAPSYTSQAGSDRTYVAMRTILTERMIANDPAVEKVAVSIPNQAGLEVISRFFYVGAAKAALQGYSAQDLSAALYQPNSFRQLVPLTREVNASARRIETAIGLTDYVQPAPNEFTLDEDGLVIKRYAIHRYITRANLEREERLTHEKAYSLTPEDDPIRCAGLTSGLTRYAYKYMLDICMKDPALFQATIAGNTATEDDPAA